MNKVLLGSKDTYIEYRGHKGSIEFEDGLYYGKVLNTKDLVSYEGKNLGELYKDFCEAIDEWEELKSEVNKKEDI